MKPDDGLLLTSEGNMAHVVAHKARCQQPVYHDKTRRYRDKPVHWTLETESGTPLTINCTLPGFHKSM